MGPTKVLVTLGGIVKRNRIPYADLGVVVTLPSSDTWPPVALCPPGSKPGRRVFNTACRTTRPQQTTTT